MSPVWPKSKSKASNEISNTSEMLSAMHPNKTRLMTNDVKLVNGEYLCETSSLKICLFKRQRSWRKCSWEDHVATLQSHSDRLQDAELIVNLVKNEAARTKIDASDVTAGSVLLQSGEDDFCIPCATPPLSFNPTRRSTAPLKRRRLHYLSPQKNWR